MQIQVEWAIKLEKYWTALWPKRRCQVFLENGWKGQVLDYSSVWTVSQGK